MTNTEIKDIIQQQLPELISNDPLIRDLILRSVSDFSGLKIANWFINIDRI